MAAVELDGGGSHDGGLYYDMIWYDEEYVTSMSDGMIEKLQNKESNGRVKGSSSWKLELGESCGATRHGGWRGHWEANLAGKFSRLSPCLRKWTQARQLCYLLPHGG